jgi:hypothetical protein
MEKSSMTAPWHWVTQDWLIAIMAALGYFATLTVIGFVFTLWRTRSRFTHWRGLDPRDQAGAILNICLIIYFFHSAIMRIFNIRGLMDGDINITETSQFLAPVLIVVGFAKTGILLWVCVEMLGTWQTALWPWLLIVVGGLFAGWLVGMT